MAGMIDATHMSPEFWVAIVGQTVVLIVTIVAAFVKTERRITKVETKVEHLEQEVKPLPGISRAVARLEGRNAVRESFPHGDV